jgi:lipopolysaccharide transport protein LptA
MRCGTTSQQTSVFSGRVVMTKGSIVLRGARLDVRQDAEGYQSACHGRGRQARVLPPEARHVAGAPEEFIEGEGEVIEYDGRTDIVRSSPRRDAPLPGRCLSDQVTGAVIVYNNLTDVFTVDGQKATPRPTAKLVAAACAPCWRPRSPPRARQRLQPRPLAQRCAPACAGWRRPVSDRSAQAAAPAHPTAAWKSLIWPSPTAAARWSRTCRWSCKKARWWVCSAPTARARPPRST